MDLDSARRITVDCDPLAFPCVQGYVDDMQQIWWDLKFLYKALHDIGEQRSWGDWVKWLKPALTAAGLGGHILAGKQDNAAVTNVMTSTAAVFFYAHTIDVGRTERVRDSCRQYLANSLQRTIQVRGDNHDINLGVGTLHLLPWSGQVSGWNTLMQALPFSARAALQTGWSQVAARGDVHSQLESDVHLLSEVSHIWLNMFRERRVRSQHRLKAGTMRQCIGLRDAFLHWLAEGIDKYILQVYSELHDLSRPAPALKSNANKYAKVHPEVIWSLIEQAKNSSSSLEQVLTIRGEDSTA